MDSERDTTGGLAASPPAASPAAETRRWRQVNFEVEFFDRILAVSPDYVDVLRCQGDLLNSLGQFRRALEIDQRLSKLLPGDCVAHYNLACSLSRMGQIEMALAALRTALERGYEDFAYLERDVDLEAVRGRPEYERLVSEFRD